MHRSLYHIRRTLTEYIRREKGKGMNKKGDARSDPPSRTARLACIGETDCRKKKDLADKKGIGIVVGAYGMIKGGLQKRNKTGIPGQCSPSVLPGLPSPCLGTVSRKQSPRPDGLLSLRR